jgi:hypothetical protein
MQHQQSGRLTLVRDDEPGPRSAPQVGQIWTACPDRGAELLVLVAEVHAEHVQAMLCGAERDWATDTDAVLDRRATGLPQRVLVHGDVSGSILTRRLRRSIAQIDPHLVERIALRGRGLDFNSSDLGRGTAIVDESDPRWDWKLERHRQLRQVRARASELGWEVYKLGPREE